MAFLSISGLLFRVFVVCEVGLSVTLRTARTMMCGSEVIVSMNLLNRRQPLITCRSTGCLVQNLRIILCRGRNPRPLRLAVSVVRSMLMSRLGTLAWSGSRCSTRCSSLCTLLSRCWHLLRPMIPVRPASNRLISLCLACLRVLSLLIPFPTSLQQLLVMSSIMTSVVKKHPIGPG